MCVICAAAKKRYMKREEVLAAIKHNSAGFFGFTVHDGVRRTIRTLDDKQFVKFFDEVVEDGDPWVMHARIPSRGEKTLDNVHGWEEDGIIFCHNMTISSIDGMMRDAKWENTDSEFFFRHIFMPFYRGCGEKAYENGRFCQDLDNIVRYFCGSMNKFLFIMPDNRLVRYGSWVTEKDRVDEDGNPAFVASNCTYKVYERSWSQRTSGGYRYPYGEWMADADWGDNDGDDGDDPPMASTERKVVAASTAASADQKRREELVDLVVKTVGLVGLCRLAMCDIVAHGAIQYRALADREAGFGDDDGESLQLLMEDALPDAFSDDTYQAAVQGLEDLAHDGGFPDQAPITPEEFATRYAEELAEPLVKSGNRGINGSKLLPYFPKEEHVETGLERFGRQWRVFRRIAGVEVDFSAGNPGAFACMADSPVKEGGRWKLRRVKAEDILVDKDLDPEVAFASAGALLEYVQENEGKERSLG